MAEEPSRHGARSPFVEFVEVADLAGVQALMRRIEEKEDHIMSVQGDIDAAVAALTGLGQTVVTAAADLTTVTGTIAEEITKLTASGADTTALNAAVAGIPTIAATLTAARQGVDALVPAAPAVPSAPAAPADPGTPAS